MNRVFPLLATGVLAFAQQSLEPLPSALSVKQLMLDVIHPASNEILLIVNRGPSDERDWAVLRRAAGTLAESGSTMVARGRVPAQAADWLRDVKMLVDAANAAYKAAQVKDPSALAALTGALDDSCTNCHKQFRSNVFPHEGASK